MRIRETTVLPRWSASPKLTPTPARTRGDAHSLRATGGASCLALARLRRVEDTLAHSSSERSSPPSSRLITTPPFSHLTTTTPTSSSRSRFARVRPSPGMPLARLGVPRHRRRRRCSRGQSVSRRLLRVVAFRSRSTTGPSPLPGASSPACGRVLPGNASLLERPSTRFVTRRERASRVCLARVGRPTRLRRVALCFGHGGVSRLSLRGCKSAVISTCKSASSRMT